MGNTEYRERELAQYLPQMLNFTLTHCYSPLSIYRNIYSSEEIMEFKERLYNTQDIDRKVQTFVARYQHIYLVSSLYMRLEGGDHCGNTDYELTIYYERVVTNLSKIHEISFKDSLHCLAVALKGFEILYKNFGYFQIFENMFHITQRGRLKVWCNQNIYKNVPEQYLLGEGKQEDMVIKVISIIDLNIDEACRVFPIRETLCHLNKITFANAIVALRQICRENNFIISENLESLENFSQFQSVLDIYAPPKRFPKDTQITFYPKNGQNSQLANQRGSKVTPMRSSSNSSHRTGNKIAGSERGRSAQISRNSKQGQGFHLTIAQEDQFPKFVAGRQRNLSKSNSSSSKKLSSSHNLQANQAENITVSHSHLQQFNKIRPQQSHLKKKTVVHEPEQPISRYSYATNHQIIPQNQQMQPVTSYNRYINNQSIPASASNPVIIQRPSTPQTIQRQASVPIFSVSYPQQVYIHQASPTYYHMQAPTQHVYPMNSVNAQPLIRKTEQFHGQGQVRSFQQPMQYRYQIHNHQQLNHSAQQQQNNQHMNQNRQNNFISNNSHINHQPQSVHNQNQIKKLEKSRGLSVPIKLSYQGLNSKQIILSPKKNEEVKKQQQFNQFSNKNTRTDNNKERLITVGDISAQKTVDHVPKIEKKDDKFQLMQLESKIEMLQSFADNKITTQQFLPNQSHALSNIKWEKNSNSGRDSVTSAFRKDILLELSNKPSQKKAYEERKDDSLFRKDAYKQISRFEDNGYYTNQRLLELIKTNTNTKQEDFPRLTLEEKMKKYENRYGKQDNIKQLTTKQSDSSDFYNDLYRRYSQKPPIASNNLFGEEVTATTPTFGPNDHAPFRKKADPYFNKISAISEKWEEENICSTSNGSRGKNIQSSNIDDDILEDMHNEGFGMLFKKGR